MGWMPRRLMLLLAGSLLLLAPLIGVQLATGAGRAHACSCALRTPSEALEGASAVFSGRVVGKSGEWRDRVEIHVDSVWKGSISSTVVVERPSECGYPGFALGEDYLVYAYRDGESLHVFLCSGTQQLEYAEEYLQALDGGGRPAGLGMLLLAAIAAAVILVRLVTWRRRRG